MAIPLKLTPFRNSRHRVSRTCRILRKFLFAMQILLCLLLNQIVVSLSYYIIKIHGIFDFQLVEWYTHSCCN